MTTMQLALPVRPAATGARTRSSIIATWRHRRQYRAELGRLLATAPHLLEDIGMTHEAARAETAKPFWQA